MSDQINTDLLTDLKTAFCYMPKSIEVNKYDHSDRVSAFPFASVVRSCSNSIA